MNLQRALVQKLECLRRSGVEAIPRSAVVANEPPPSAAALAPPEPAQRPSITNRSAAAHPPVTAGSSDSSTATTLFTNAEAFTTPPMAAADRSAALSVLASEVSACSQCTELASKRTQTVFGVGNPNARLVFFGEAPGADEDRQGEPFVGRAGQLLTKIIEACQLKREEVYILNVLKCRPPGNRNPTPEEAQNCRPYFERQLEIIRPEMICCLGAIAATTLLDTTMSVGRLRGKFHQWRGIPVAVTYHPSYLLRTPAAKKSTWADMKMVMRALGVEL